MYNFGCLGNLYAKFYIVSFLTVEGDLQCPVILAPRPPMHFLHKTFPGTIDKTSHSGKFHSSSCLVSWLIKIRSCSFANWEATYFSQNIALLNISFTVHKLYTWLTHPEQLCDMPDISLVSLTGFWYPWQRGNNQTDLCETTQCSNPLYAFFQVKVVLATNLVFILNTSNLFMSWIEKGQWKIEN